MNPVPWTQRKWRVDQLPNLLEISNPRDMIRKRAPANSITKEKINGRNVNFISMQGMIHLLMGSRSVKAKNLFCSLVDKLFQQACNSHQLTIQQTQIQQIEEPRSVAALQLIEDQDALHNNMCRLAEQKEEDTIAIRPREEEEEEDQIIRHPPVTVSERCKELYPNIEPNKKMSIRIGKAVAKQENHTFQKRARFVGGAARKLYQYSTEHEIHVLDAVIHAKLSAPAHPRLDLYFPLQIQQQK